MSDVLRQAPRSVNFVTEGISAVDVMPSESLSRFAPVDIDFYLRRYPDVGDAGVDPTDHYLIAGRREGRLPRDEAEILRASQLVDENYYFINGPDVHASGLSAVDHYINHGWAEYRRPNAYFDGRWYRDRYAPPDSMSPLCHYLVQGEALGYRPSLYFDPDWYRTAYGIAAQESPLRHYLENRRDRRVSPLPLFDISFYVTTYAAELGRARDIFAHYLTVGAAREFDPSPWFSATQYRQTQMVGKPPPPGAPDEVMRNPLLHFLYSFVILAGR
ncbi:hypothetical protein [Acidisoma cladoniae]|jgi:hypothetical protein|uniref:hypothetical protein n=1 Tax=Acidisoma cladoniae TaxID=3040935 RepID=UPI00254B63EF|nr:hypothetical protein [Acidisoma sp. PAMC 29798]